MDLHFNIAVAKGYKSNSQIARVLTEDWVGSYGYCPACGNKKLNAFANNSPVADFYCTCCNSEYELKSQKDKLADKIVNGAYDSMLSRIHAENSPHFFLLNYSKHFKVSNFFVIPNFYFTDDIIEKRKALASHFNKYIPLRTS